MQSFVPVPKTLKHASYVPAEPARLVSSGLFAPAVDLTFQIGDGASVTYAVDPEETAVQFLTRIVTSGTAVDENGQNPLTISVSDHIELSSRARIRGNGFTLLMLFGAMDIDVSPSPARVYDTDSDHTRHGEGSVADAIHALDIRVDDPYAVIRGSRRHPPAVESTLVSLGATPGEQISVVHGSGLDMFEVTSGATATTFMDWLNASPELNPNSGGGLGTQVYAIRDMLFESIVIVSRERKPISIVASTGAVSALLGMPPL